MLKNTKTVTVGTLPPYEVHIGANILSSCGEWLKELIPTCKAAVITDSTVAELYLNRVKESLEYAGFSVVTHIFPAGERSKDLSTYGEILNTLASAELTRSDCIVALGGGVVGDISGFAAATYLRGIKFVQMPTTLLADVDASVGGKTAVDLPMGKNLVGSFIQPSAVLCDTECLRTLPAEVFADGVAEAIKTAVLSGEDLFSLFECTDPCVRIPDIITSCVSYKANIVSRDPKENGMRKLLNLGHTVGHAVEKCSDYTISHGHAVAVGIAVITRASERLGLTTEPLSERISRCLQRNSLPTTTNFTAEELTQAALSDKKRSGDKLTLVIPKHIGECCLADIPVSELRRVISAGLEV